MNKKIVLLLALVATLILVLVACGTDSEPVDTTVATEAPAETTEAPAETTEAPAETTEAPVETTEAPVEETTAEPETEAPVEETTAEPETEAPDNSLNIDLSTVTSSGNYPNVDVPVPGSVFGTDHCFALHYGSINLGEIDLSRYSKVIVTYATPDDATVPGASDQYNKTGKRVLLLNAPSASQGTFEYLPEESAIITSTQYEMSPASLTTTTVEIDLTNVTYNGTVYLTFDYRDAENGQAATGFLVWVTGISLE